MMAVLDIGLRIIGRGTENYRKPVYKESRQMQPAVIISKVKVIPVFALEPYLYHMHIAEALSIQYHPATQVFFRNFYRSRN